MRLAKGETGLWHGFWFTLDGKRLERVSRAELGEAYRLYRIGTGYGLTDRAVDGAAQRRNHGARDRMPDPSPRVPSRGSQSEANPFHDEAA